jgi:NTE family protein
MDQTQLRFDGVFEGGGVKGLALVGAYSVLEAHGYRPANLAGTSAGAVVAALVAAGYRASELAQILLDLDFSTLLDPPAWGQIPLLGPLVDVLTGLGLYKGDAFIGFLRALLAAKHKRTFADFVLPEFAEDPRYRYGLKVVASDLSRGRMLVLPDDAQDYGLDPDQLEVALAVRMSMSIPFFFRPVKLPTAGNQPSYVVDGGLLSNFPVDLFDAPGIPAWPTFGFHLAAQVPAPVIQHRISGPISMLQATFATMMAAHDARYLEQHQFVRTIVIDTLGVSTVDFALDADTKRKLLQSGVAAAEDFLAHWDFERYRELYRSGRPLPRRRQLVLSPALVGG